MKTWNCTKRFALCTGALFTLMAAWAADTPATAPAVVNGAAASEVAPAKLPYGVEDVLKLSRAQVSEDIVQNYIRNSGTIYTLSPNDIVYLRDQGVSDRIINAMLDQRQRVTETAAQAAPAPAQAPASAPAYADTATAAAAPSYTYAEPAPVEVQPAPSTLYVIPYPQATSGFYPRYPSPYYYGSYWGGYYGPSVSFGFRFGSGWGHGGWRGGYHGGYHGGYRGHR